MGNYIPNLLFNQKGFNMTNDQLSLLLNGKRSVNAYSFSYTEEDEIYKLFTTDCIDIVVDSTEVDCIVNFGAFHIFILKD